MKKRYSNSFTYSVAYSWSKTIDISSGETAGAIGVLDPNNLKRTGDFRILTARTS